MPKARNVIGSIKLLTFLAKSSTSRNAVHGADQEVKSREASCFSAVGTKFTGNVFRVSLGIREREREREARNVFAWITNGANVFANTPLRDDLALALLAVRGGTILSACACAREHFLFTGKSTPSYEGRSCPR